MLADSLFACSYTIVDYKLEQYFSLTPNQPAVNNQRSFTTKRSGLLSTLEVVAGVARDAMPPFCNKFYFIRLLCNQSIIKFACKNTVLVWGQWSNDVVLAYRPCAFNREILRVENLYAWLLRICTTCSVPSYRLPSITLTPRKAPVPSHVGICSSDAKLPIQPHKSKPNFPTRHSTFQYPCNFLRGRIKCNTQKFASF